MNTPDPETPLETHVPMPNGGFALRCQRVKKDAAQCKKPARTGYRVCGSHGAGYAKRERAGERKKPGRPVTHGIYSNTPTRSYAEAMEEVAQLEGILTNSDRALIALKAVLVYQLGQLDGLAPETNQLEGDMEAYVAEAAELNTEPLTPTEARRLARQFAGWLRPLSKIDKAVNRVSDTAPKVFAAHKARAETEAKLAEARGLEAFVTLNQTQRAIIHALTPDRGMIDAYEDALRREIYGPNHLEVPALNPYVLTYPVEKPVN